MDWRRNWRTIKCCDCLVVQAYMPEKDCRACIRLRKERRQQRRWRDKNRATPGTPWKGRRWARTLGFAFSEQEATTLLEKQNGVCAICKHSSEVQKLHLDHDHKTKRVRGFLCFSCNTALGKFKDSRTLLFSAIEYLVQTQA